MSISFQNLDGHSDDILKAAASKNPQEVQNSSNMNNIFLMTSSCCLEQSRVSWFIVLKPLLSPRRHATTVVLSESTAFQVFRSFGVEVGPIGLVSEPNLSVRL